MVDNAQIERVKPSDIALLDILLVAKAHDSEFAEVTVITEHLKGSRCRADRTSAFGHDPLREFDAFHFTVDVYSQEGERRQSGLVICEPTAVSVRGRIHVNEEVPRSIQR